ncbi:MAG TPA: TonB-dependent receptor, partial [Longimicrobiaceae bacterium]|nr:TonB-dependent receptor [Longimicrobiaceae bacterium]
AGCTPAEQPAPPRRWSPPLDRPVSLSVRDVPLRSALDRLSAASRLRLSYSADLLPLDRRVCATGDSLAVGEVLAGLLRGTGVAPVVAGPEHVVLAPAPGRAPGEAMATVALDRIVVTGRPGGSQERALPFGVEVVGGEELAERGTDGVAEALSSTVPGVWAWSPSPSSVLVRYGSIRGASSFGASHPKVYIDGIEVANPLLLSRIDPEAVERVEVVRGPQGAALYGTDAISGVVNVVTRHEGGGGGAPLARIRSGFGVAQSDFAAGGSLSQEHGLTLRAGSETRSLGLSVSGRTAGEHIPEAFSRSLAAVAGARRVGARSITTGVARFAAEDAGVSASPLLGGLSPARPDSAVPTPAGAAGSQSVRQYTLGINTVFVPDDRWTHSLVAGIDGNRVAGVPDVRSPFRLADASTLGSPDGGADRATLRGSSVARLGARGGVSGGLALMAEHSVLRETAVPAVDWRQRSAVLAQVHAGLHESLWATAGLRLERNEGLAGEGQLSALPMLGAAWLRSAGDLTLKLRAAYGKGIRPPQDAAREAARTGLHPQGAGPDLDPEEQSGVEGGIDLQVGGSLSLHVTRFDQLASGLIQRVPFERAASAPYASRAGRREPGPMAYRLQNVGEIANRGWEVQGSAELGRLSLDGTLSLVDSRVRRVGTGYTGDLRPGDRMLEVPARTASLSAAWFGVGWYGSLTAARAWDWVNYDYLALARASADGSWPSGEPAGARLREFWRVYPGITHLRATVARDLRPGVSVVLTGDNLLNRQLGEPDNVTVLPGRTVMLGLRAEF